MGSQKGRLLGLNKVGRRKLKSRFYDNKLSGQVLKEIPILKNAGSKKYFKFTIFLHAKLSTISTDFQIAKKWTNTPQFISKPQDISSKLDFSSKAQKNIEIKIQSNLIWWRSSENIYLKKCKENLKYSNDFT